MLLINSKKKIIILVIVIFLLGFIVSIFTYSKVGESYQSIAMYMYIEKKEHHIEPAKYMKMWVNGSNASDTDPNKTRYKVMIKDSSIYNLLEEGKEYFVTLEGIKKRNQEEYVYTFGQIELPGGSNLRGEGIIE